MLDDKIQREIYFSFFFFFFWKIQGFFIYGLIVMGDLLRWKNKKVEKYKDFLGGLILMGGLPRSKLKESHYDGWQNTKIFQMA
jgi:hypothetical protein